MVNNLTDEKIAEFREVFLLFDKDGDGHISTNELGVVLRALGAAPSQLEIQEMTEANETGFIDFQQFLKLISESSTDQSNKEKELRKAFNIFDNDNNGFITVADLKHILTCLGEEPLTEEEYSAVIAALDSDNDGRVTFNDFCNIMK